MNVLIVLYYYRPHYSGLTIYTERLARALGARGHQVTVLTSQFDANLPRYEQMDGVEVVRQPVAFRISKGPIIPSFLPTARKYLRQVQVVNLHLPQLDAAPIAMLARLMRVPVVTTYHCDLLLPTGLVHRLANLASNTANHITAMASNLMVTNTQDYAVHSPFLSKYLSKVKAIPPPAQMPPSRQSDIVAFREKYGIRKGDRVIGMVGRLAAEKGAEHLIKALPKILEAIPGARAIHAGQSEHVMGEEGYAARLRSQVEGLGAKWQFLGLISDEELSAFFHICDVVALPSTNSTESFGMVLVEAMTCGTPGVTSDLPGMRMSVRKTGMGATFPMGDEDALAEAIIDILQHGDQYQGNVPAITQRYAPDTIAAEYEAIFDGLTGK